MQCLFCAIINGDIPCHKLYEDDRAIAFLTIGPVSEGHTLVVPKMHAENLTEGSREDAAHLLAVVHGLAPKICAAVGASGYNLGMNHGVIAGQEVLHTHLHVMPRKEGAARSFERTHPSQDQLLVTAEKIRAALH